MESHRWVECTCDRGYIEKQVAVSRPHGGDKASLGLVNNLLRLCVSLGVVIFSIDRNTPSTTREEFVLRADPIPLWIVDVLPGYDVQSIQVSIGYVALRSDMRRDEPVEGREVKLSLSYDHRG